MERTIYRIVKALDNMSYIIEDILKGGIKQESERMLQDLHKIQAELIDLYWDAYDSSYEEVK